MSETSVLQAIEDAILAHTYTITWAKKIYYADQFQPTGWIHKHRCPLLVFPNGVESDMHGVTHETFQGMFNFSIWSVVSRGIIAGKEPRTYLAQFSQEVMDAIKPLDGYEQIINLEIGFGETRLLKGMIGRELKITYESAECK